MGFISVPERISKVGVGYRVLDRQMDRFDREFLPADVLGMCIVRRVEERFEMIGLQPIIDGAKVSWSKQFIRGWVDSDSTPRNKSFEKLARAVVLRLGSQAEPSAEVVLPRLWYGFSHRPSPVLGKNTRIAAAAAGGMTLLQFDKLDNGTKFRRACGVWSSVIREPRAGGNTTGLWLVPAAEAVAIGGKMKPFFDLPGMVGVEFHRMRPAMDLFVGRRMRAKFFAAWGGIPQDLGDSPEATEAWHRTCEKWTDVAAGVAKGIASIRLNLGPLSSMYSDEAILQHMEGEAKEIFPDTPLNELIIPLRHMMKPGIAAMCSDADLLKALRNPTDPLFASHACAMQAVHEVAFEGGKYISSTGDSIWYDA